MADMFLVLGNSTVGSEKQLNDWCNRPRLEKTVGSLSGGELAVRYELADKGQPPSEYGASDYQRWSFTSVDPTCAAEDSALVKS